MVTLIQPMGTAIGVATTAIVCATIAQTLPPSAVLRSLFRAPAREQRVLRERPRRT